MTRVAPYSSTAHFKVGVQLSAVRSQFRTNCGGISFNYVVTWITGRLLHASHLNSQVGLESWSHLSSSQILIGTVEFEPNFVRTKYIPFFEQGSICFSGNAFSSCSSNGGSYSSNIHSQDLDVHWSRLSHLRAAGSHVSWGQDFSLTLAQAITCWLLFRAQGSNISWRSKWCSCSVVFPVPWRASHSCSISVFTG